MMKREYTQEYYLNVIKRYISFLLNKIKQDEKNVFTSNPELKAIPHYDKISFILQHDFMKQWVGLNSYLIKAYEVCRKEKGVTINSILKSCFQLLANHSKEQNENIEQMEFFILIILETTPNFLPELAYLFLNKENADKFTKEYVNETLYNDLVQKKEKFSLLLQKYHSEGLTVTLDENMFQDAVMALYKIEQDIEFEIHFTQIRKQFANRNIYLAYKAELKRETSLLGENPNMLLAMNIGNKLLQMHLDLDREETKRLKENIQQEEKQVDFNVYENLILAAKSYKLLKKLYEKSVENPEKACFKYLVEYETRKTLVAKKLKDDKNVESILTDLVEFMAQIEEPTSPLVDFDDLFEEKENVDIQEDIPTINTEKELPKIEWRGTTKELYDLFLALHQKCWIKDFNLKLIEKYFEKAKGIEKFHHDSIPSVFEGIRVNLKISEKYEEGKIIWLGSQKNLGEFFIELWRKKWIKQIPVKLVMDYFSKANTFPDVMKRKKEEDIKLSYPKIYTEKYKKSFDKISSNIRG